MRVADASGLRRLVTVYGGIVHDKASTSVVNGLSGATPRITGRLERARRRRDTLQGTTFVAAVEQPGGADEPNQLPNWLDAGTEFDIVPVRAQYLRFRGRGGQVIFAKRVRWRPRPASIGFWSRTVNATTWAQSLQQAQASTTVGPS